MGKGGGPLKIPQVKKAFNALTNHAANFFTMGLVGYDAEKGQLQKGYLTHAADEGVGEITGRNIMRGEANKAADRLREEEAKQAQELRDKQLRDYRMDIMASRSAQGVRDTAAARTTKGPAGTKATEVLGTDDEELLGL